MVSVFDKRVAFKPFEYPEILKYQDAINHSYWLVSEWNFISDIQDFNQLSTIEKEAIKRAMLAISQIEVSVKEFWAKLGDRFPKAEFKQVGITFGESECFDDQTEVLTNNGWRFFHDLKESDLVAQYCIEGGKISFTKPLKYVKRFYTGKMHHYYNKCTDLMVTPNHDIIVMHPQHSTYTKKQSVAGRWGRNYRYPCAGIGTSSDPLHFTELDRLLIALQSDGCLFGNCPSGQGRRDFTFRFSKQRKINRLLEICKNLGIELLSSIKENGQKTFNGRLPDEAPDVSKIKDFSYIDITRVDYKYANAFLNEIKHWDSSIAGKNFTYYNSNDKAVDTVQIIATLGEKCSNKGINRTEEQLLDQPTPDGKRRMSCKTIYALNITNYNKKTYPYRTEVNYNGNVYCVTVNSGCVVTRRGCRVAISGNCRHANAYSRLLEILGLNDEFNTLLDNPIIQGRVDYLTKYLKGASDNSNEGFTLTLSLFSLFIENVSLFSQFLIIKSFNKYTALLKDIDNVVQATQQEENIHALFGMEIIGIIKKEFPEWFNEEFYTKLYRACKKAYESEEKIVDWIFENGELSFLSKEAVKEFIKHRFNVSIQSIGGEKVFEIDYDLLDSINWFEEELVGDVSTDFFHKKPTTYTKFNKSIQAEDLF